MSTHTTHVDTVIIGAGLSGIGTACHVSRAFPERSISILERRERVGGTWDLFRYPGIRSDSDMFTFGYEFRPWHDLKVLADGSSIRQYVEDTAAEYDVLDKVQFGVQVRTAEWSSADERWTITAVHEATGETRVVTASFLISCTGYYSHDEGHLPDFAGIDDFEGQVVHPQFWPEDLDHAGKKVVVIGSGATAVTLVPTMSEDAAHVTMLQRSPSYIFSIPSYDKISEKLGKWLPQSAVYRFGRWRNIAVQRGIYLASRRWPAAMRRFLLSQVRRQLGPDVDMTHFTPNYMPWDERLCAVPNGDLFAALRDGRASVVTDHIDTFTDKGIRLRSGDELEADLVITATGLTIQMLGGVELIVDGQARRFEDQLTYKATLIEGIPNFGWVFGYTNAPWTLKSDIAATYLCRLLTHMADNGHTVVVPRDTDDQSLGIGMLDALQSGYVQRAKDTLPRQGRSGPWQVRMHYGQDKKMLLDEPVVDGHLQFSSSRALSAAV
ncbi:NAD(P)/FAD-dependent oxidoreductase [Gordonia sp. PKS22-38]|uniref:NAD(P)/FAD-dependent oxidoreductase n=1 Tax=Gordonia prachuapensis TaxID=3115651 RepID=A0ABU7N0D4_9ACTN|nr:NAD(P)/FAD-dependent oxidoreductase [Gordonia sp. PKS22-38]